MRQEIQLIFPSRIFDSYGPFADKDARSALINKKQARPNPLPPLFETGTLLHISGENSIRFLVSGNEKGISYIIKWYLIAVLKECPHRPMPSRPAGQRGRI